MPKSSPRLPDARPLLDLTSYARPGPARRDRLSPAQIEHIRRTVHRIPEVMVKVLSHGGTDLKSVQRHLAYIGRKGELNLETDDGEQLRGQGIEKSLLKDWDLDLDTYRRQLELSATTGRKRAKLVHKVLFSMPPGTPPTKVLAAVKNFAREQFAGQHRYVMALHTDEPHPHVHMVIKAVSEQGVRLNIRKETLREWRREFARHLRELGVPANATERAVRGNTKTPKRDGIYRAILRGASTHFRERVHDVARETPQANQQAEPGQAKLQETRNRILQGWQAVSAVLMKEGERELARDVARFVQRMPSPATENQLIAEQLRKQAAVIRARDEARTR